MQEKATEKRPGLTARLRARNVSVSRRRLLWLTRELLWGGAAYLIGLGTMLFDTKPLGVALICAGRGHLIGILAGLVISELALMQDPVLMICTYAAAALIRAVSYLLLDSPNARAATPARARRQDMPAGGETAGGPEEGAGRLTALRQSIGRAARRLRADLRGMFSESVCLRMATSAVSMLVVSLYRIIGGGFRYYDLFAAVFSVLVAPAAVLVWSVWTDGRQDSPVLRAISGGALMYALVWSANSAAIGQIPVSAILALLIPLLVADRHGTGLGCAAGVLCGVAYNPLQAPAFLLAALVYGGIRRKGQSRAGAAAACLAAWVWSFYAQGGTAFSVALPAYLIAGTAFALLSRLPDERPAGPSAGEAVPDPETALRCERSRHEDANDRFRDISEAFSTLSEMFYNLSDRLRRPGALDLRRICDSSFDAVCTDCPNKTVCWGLEYSDTLNVMSGLIARLHTKGRVSGEQIPEHLRQRCHAMDEILERINAECARFTGELLRNNRTEIFAMDYEAAANIINDALEEDAGEYRFDPELEARLCEYLRDAGIVAQSVSVYGMRRRQLIARGVNIDRSTVTMETLRSDLGEMCGLELSMPAFEVENNVTSMLLQARRKLSVVGAQKNLSADGGVSGDSVNLFSNKKDFFYALISDGMGAGREAALTSGLCSTFLEKMLRAGNRANTSLRMLNNLILSRCPSSAGECSSTIDLIELDLITGSASFIKGGAAPSFVVRGGTVHRLQAGTAPIGIIRRLDTQTTRFDLRAGDTVVMVSDGILQDDPECRWLTGLLGSCGDVPPEELVRRICRHAAQAPRHDDCSAVALRIQAAEEGPGAAD